MSEDDRTSYYLNANDWLTRDVMAAADAAQEEIERLRGLLARLLWGLGHFTRGAYCPLCQRLAPEDDGNIVHSTTCPVTLARAELKEDAP